MGREKEFNFAKAIEELQKITREFEQGSLDLDEGLKKFEQGLKLAQLCKKRLSQAENEVQEIKAKFGEEKEKPPTQGSPEEPPVEKPKSSSDKQLF